MMQNMAQNAVRAWPAIACRSVLCRPLPSTPHEWPIAARSLGTSRCCHMNRIPAERPPCCAQPPVRPPDRPPPPPGLSSDAATPHARPPPQLMLHPPHPAARSQSAGSHQAAKHCDLHDGMSSSADRRVWSRPPKHERAQEEVWASFLDAWGASFIDNPPQGAARLFGRWPRPRAAGTGRTP